MTSTKNYEKKERNVRAVRAIHFIGF